MKRMGVFQFSLSVTLTLASLLIVQGIGLPDQTMDILCLGSLMVFLLSRHLANDPSILRLIKFRMRSESPLDYRLFLLARHFDFGPYASVFCLEQGENGGSAEYSPRET